MERLLATWTSLIQVHNGRGLYGGPQWPHLLVFVPLPNSSPPECGQHLWLASDQQMSSESLQPWLPNESGMGNLISLTGFGEARDPRQPPANHQPETEAPRPIGGKEPNPVNNLVSLEGESSQVDPWDKITASVNTLNSALWELSRSTGSAELCWNPDHRNSEIISGHHVGLLCLW